MASPLSLPLLRGEITLPEALEAEDNVLEKLTYPEKRLEFCGYLHTHAKEIEAIEAHHLAVAKQSCTVPWVNEWLHGSFNVCIPVHTNGAKKVIIRFPLPYKVGESTHPGNAAEKLRTEVATYAWMQSHCPLVPIPRLWGFGFPAGSSFTALDRAPLLSRFVWHLRRSLAWIRGIALPSRYVAHPHRQSFTSGYMLVDYVQDGRMLSETWGDLCGDYDRRKMLFRDLSRIMLSLARVQFPRIGSLTMDDRGVVSLTNRPLTLQLHQLENECIPTHIPRYLTYPSTDTYLADLLACHDSRIQHRPNSVLDREDAWAQLSTLTMMRALGPHFTDREQRFGPFTFMLTDLHQSNIFVDENWHVTCLVDLEWACALPSEMLHPPIWLTGHAIDIIDDYLEEYQERHGEFIAVFAEEEQKMAVKTTAVPDNTTAISSTNTTTVTTTSTPTTNTTRFLASRMRAGWNTGTFWYVHALQSFTGMYHLFIQHIQPLYGPTPEVRDGGDVFERVVASYWTLGADQFVHRKIDERGEYLERVREVFRKSVSGEDGR